MLLAHSKKRGPLEIRKKSEYLKKLSLNKQEKVSIEKIILVTKTGFLKLRLFCLFKKG